MQLFVGAYAASPSLAGWDPVTEADYLHRVLALEGVRGLETPWPGLPDAFDLAWVSQAIPSSCDLVITDIGSTLHAVRQDSTYGLASNDRHGRQRAIEDAARLREDVERAVQQQGRSCVTAVELHSAPLASSGSSAALRASLEEIAAWNWQGADVLVEHCDTLLPTHTPEKGYLGLDDEIAATSGLAGLAMNWGRSAIELRDPDAVAAQVAHAAASGLLRGFVFSGVSPTTTACGPAWQDNHPAFAPDAVGGYGEPASLLTARRAAEALEAAGPLTWVAVKMGFHPLNAPTDAKLRMIEHAVRTVRSLDPVGTSADSAN